jgi:flagellar M-ring protein FliF
MADTALQAQQQVARFVRRLTLSQKLLLGGTALAAIVAIIVLVTLVNKPTYGTLFSNLGEQDASKIVEKLKEKQIPYTLEDGGKTILVPRQQIYDLRLSLAGEGLPQSSTIGYEIFDRTNLGISDFVQKVNYRRALEGELARTILQLEEVEGARVHLVVPEKALFKEDERPSTASVVLKLRTGRPLKKETVQGIAHLVSSSVEGLEVGNVTIVDSRGSLLSDATKPNSVAALTSSQYELQQKVENYVAGKAQTLLESVVGRGNALVQVNADLDFRQVERTLESYDPENTAVRSEQVSEEKSVVSDSAPPSTRSNTITNYEVNKTVEHIVENLGNIKRLSVAALVNGIPKTVEKDGQKTTEIVSRPKEEMDKLTDLVRKAVGYNLERNDEISVTNLSFGPAVQDQDFVYRQEPGTDWTGWSQKIFLGVAMLVAVLVIWSLLGRLRSRIEPEAGYAMGGGGSGMRGGMSTYETDLSPAGEPLRPRRSPIHLPKPEEEISEETLIKIERKKRIIEYLQTKPEDGSRLLKVWLGEE